MYTVEFAGVELTSILCLLPETIVAQLVLNNKRERLNNVVIFFILCFNYFSFFVSAK